MGAGEDKRARATRIANSTDTPAKIDVHWLTSEAIGAWNKVDALEAEVERLRAENERLRAIEAAARGVIHAARLLDEQWHRGAGDDAEHRALCDALDRYWLLG